MSTQAPSSPVSNKKGRGPHAHQNQKNENRDPEFNAEFAQIEKDLIQHKLGTFKVFEDDMTFKWADTMNREIASESQIKELQRSMECGIYRTDLQNRMSGIIARRALEGKIFGPNFKAGDEAIEFREVEKFNKEAEYPVIMLDGGTKIEMQSGQHRMEVLKKLRKAGKDRWWIVTIYDMGM